MIVSTTLAPKGCGDILGDALASVVNIVDKVILIDTSDGQAAAAQGVARQIAREKLVIRSMIWPDNFGEARNCALDIASEEGATWAITVDPDERIVTKDPAAFRRELEKSDAGALVMAYVDGSYHKDRVIRLPTRERWVGSAHEFFPSHIVGRGICKTARFHEVRKSQAAYQKKFRRGVRVLREELANDPENPRLYYYLGESFKNLYQYEEAVKAYVACAKLPTWDTDQAGRAMYRAAECCLDAMRPEEALRHAMTGLAHAPTSAELYWLAGVASLRLGRCKAAIGWAKAAIGVADDKSAAIIRTGQIDLAGLYEGPWHVLMMALEALGDTNGATAARFKRDERQATRARLFDSGLDSKTAERPS